MILGVDVSGWNTSINWKTLYDGGVRFAIVKLTQGTSSLTILARDHIEGARKVGILVGAYHWNDPMLNDNQQVSFFASQLEKHNIHLAYVDVEQYWQDWNEWYKRIITKFISSTRISQSAYNMMTGIRNLGYNGQIYSRWSFIKERASPMQFWIPSEESWYAHYPYATGRINANWQDFEKGGRWYPGIPQPSLPSNVKWKIWQFSGDKFILPGTGGSPIDLNFFPGTEADLIKFFTGDNTELPNPEPPIVIEPPISEVVMPKLKVISEVRLRTSPSTATLANYKRMRKVGEIVNVEEMKIFSSTNIWVRDNEGWSALVYGKYLYME